MTTLYRLSIEEPSFSLEDAWQLLEEGGIEILYGSEEEGHIELFVHLSSPDLLLPYQWIATCEPYTLPPIDWQAQWASHGYHFQEGYVNIDFADFGRPTASQLRLKPGSGFGDLSHPTTHLLVNMLAHYLHNHIVIDIGCGSGVLSLAAAAMGAPMVYGIDIDPQAVEHSIQNALLNNLSKQCQSCTPQDFIWHRQSHPILIVMNMIASEQLVAWPYLQSLHDQPAEMLTSGIQCEERLVYLEQMAKWGWSVKHEKEEKGWLAFHCELTLRAKRDISA